MADKSSPRPVAVGQAGNIILNVADRITLSGFNPDSPNSVEAASGLYANTARNSSGPGGTVQITTRQLNVFDRAKIAVNSQGSGIAGNIDISANRVQLANQASLTAETTAVNGGDITLRNVELLLLRNGSLISTTAGTDRAGGNGGNINLDAEFIVAVRNENSDIRANAFTGSGGSVRITTQGLFGIAPRLRDNPFTSDITASSDLGVQGTVNITPPNVDPNRGLIELPVGVVDAANQITQTCPGVGARKNTGEFVVKGRGGLPSSPLDTLVGNEPLAGWAALDEKNAAAIAPQSSGVTLPPSSVTATAPIVEAQGWIVAKDGAVRLVAATPASGVQPAAVCH